MSQQPNNKQESKEDKEFPGYPASPAGEDIYNREEETDIDPEDLTKAKTMAPVNPDMPNEKDFKNDKSGDDLDVPGADLDDEDEEVGSEDEENNYYSLGGDNHENLEEDNGD
jgi:hypothetical protein